MNSREGWPAYLAAREKGNPAGGGKSIAGSTAYCHGLLLIKQERGQLIPLVRIVNLHLQGTPMPLALTDDQLQQIFRAARPLRPRDRSAFLQMIADRQRDHLEPGDGELFRIVAEAQRAFYDPPFEGGYAAE